MSAYQSLYRKYRPQRFADLVGQTHVVTALQNATREGRIGHAYLFSGPRGTGKTTTARILAKAIGCTDLGADGDPCGVCATCMAIADGSSLDVIEVDAASKSRVEEMRDLIESVAYSAAGGGRKVYILDEVHMLSASAEAALLKTLEESPAHVVFVLATTDPFRVAPTIRSRTQHYEFTLYSLEEISGHLARVLAAEGVDADPEALAVIARVAAGSMRDSLSLLDQALADGPLDLEHVEAILGGTAFAGRLRILEAVADEDASGAVVGLAELLDAGVEPRRLAEDLLLTARDAFLLGTAKGKVRVDAPDDDVAILESFAERVGTPALVRVLESLGQAVVDMRGADAAHPRLVLEVAVVRLARRDAGTSVQALAERVARLERRLDDAPASVTGDEAARASFGTLRRTRAPSPAATAAPENPPPPAAARPDDVAPPADEPPPADEAPQGAPDLDDVILVWADILPGFSPVTRAAAQEAQPISVQGNVITFGIPTALFKTAEPRFKREADNIRAALSERLGRRGLKFVLKARDTLPGAAADDAPGPPPSAPSGPAPSASAPVPDDDVVDLAELTDAPDGDASALDSVGLFTTRFDATVVEERPRD